MKPPGQNATARKARREAFWLDPYPVAASHHRAAGPSRIAAGPPRRRQQRARIIPAGIHLVGQDLVQRGPDGLAHGCSLQRNQVEDARIPANNGDRQPFCQRLSDGRRHRRHQVDPLGAQVGGSTGTVMTSCGCNPASWA